MNELFAVDVFSFRPQPNVQLATDGRQMEAVSWASVRLCHLVVAAHIRLVSLEHPIETDAKLD